MSVVTLGIDGGQSGDVEGMPDNVLMKKQE